MGYGLWAMGLFLRPDGIYGGTEQPIANSP